MNVRMTALLVLLALGGIIAYHFGAEGIRGANKTRMTAAVDNPLQKARKSNQNTDRSGFQPRPVYEIRDGKAYIPDWDDSPETAPIELLRLRLQDFEKPPRSGLSHSRLVVENEIRSNTFRIPENASELVFFGRGHPDDDIFPRVRISFVAEGAQSDSRTLFEGHLLTLPTDYITCPVPAAIRGRNGRIVIKLLNPSDVRERRAFHVGYVAFR